MFEEVMSKTSPNASINFYLHAIFKILNIVYYALNIPLIWYTLMAEQILY